jgi:hypothetical protein
MEINRRHRAVRSARNGLASRSRILTIAAVWFAINSSPAIARAERGDHNDRYLPPVQNSPKGAYRVNHYGASPAASSSASPHSTSMTTNAVTAKTTAGTTGGTPPASNVLPPVPATAFIQVPPVPTDPIVPATTMPPAPVASVRQAPQSANVEFGAAQSYQINCVLPGGNYCVFPNAFPVTAGSKCHCGQAAGSTE